VCPLTCSPGQFLFRAARCKRAWEGRRKQRRSWRKRDAGATRRRKEGGRRRHSGLSGYKVCQRTVGTGSNTSTLVWLRSVPQLVSKKNQRTARTQGQIGPRGSERGGNACARPIPAPLMRCLCLALVPGGAPGFPKVESAALQAFASLRCVPLSPSRPVPCCAVPVSGLLCPCLSSDHTHISWTQHSRASSQRHCMVRATHTPPPPPSRRSLAGGSGRPLRHRPAHPSSFDCVSNTHVCVVCPCAAFISTSITFFNKAVLASYGFRYVASGGEAKNRRARTWDRENSDWRAGNNGGRVARAVRSPVVTL
jgi:hypothetical protein